MTEIPAWKQKLEPLVTSYRLDCEGVGIVGNSDPSVSEATYRRYVEKASRSKEALWDAIDSLLDEAEISRPDPQAMFQDLELARAERDDALRRLQEAERRLGIRDEDIRAALRDMGVRQGFVERVVEAAVAETDAENLYFILTNPTLDSRRAARRKVVDDLLAHDAQVGAE